ncbi:hypothetical protein JMN32_10455 [Fulvivirga sp. 29W222]|uniref:Uncharacterized protein n=1 Tax=Fulvivirga marina TaxID=2494733 RepID=A0A937KE46_9BACT|nr:hypothetical protein [Fulvivirga marina]MBL6446735.1 hypothetical protein [Fulvivirga marina]
MLLIAADNWFRDNRDKLIETSIGEIDYYPPDRDDSLSFGFEAENFVYQVVIWEEGYIKVLRLDKQTMTEDVENVQARDSKELINRLNDFLMECLKNNMH